MSIYATPGRTGPAFLSSRNANRLTSRPWPPTSTTTGVPPGQSLTTYGGSLTITTNGTLLENFQFNRGLVIEGSNVTIRRSRFDNNDTDFFTLLVKNTGLIVEDCTFAGHAGTRHIDPFGGAGSSMTLRQLNVSGAPDCISMSNGSLLEWSLVECGLEQPGDHNDSVTADETSGTIIRENTIFNQNGETAAVWIGTPGSPSSVTLTHNLLAGGGYTIYAGPGTATVADNWFSTRYFTNSGSVNYLTNWELDGPGTSGTWTNNRWYDGPNAGQLIAA